MEPVLRSLILKRFRSIPAGTVQLDNPTVVVGRGRVNIQAHRLTLRARTV
jgi:hypothetical protein